MATDIEKRDTASRVEIGRTGLEHWSGLVHEEFLTQLSGERGRKIFLSEDSQGVPNHVEVDLGPSLVAGLTLAF